MIRSARHRQRAMARNAGTAIPPSGEIAGARRGPRSSQPDPAPSEGLLTLLITVGLGLLRHPVGVIRRGVSPGRAPGVGVPVIGHATVIR